VLDIKRIEKDPDGVFAKLRRRGELPELSMLSALLVKRKSLIASVQTKRSERNAASKALQSADKAEIEKRRGQLRNLSQEIRSEEQAYKHFESELNTLLALIPNMPADNVPDGASEDDNVEIRRVLEPAHFDFKPLDHVALGERWNLIDFERAAKMSGARFAFLRGPLAKLNRALIQFFCDYHVNKGDIELCSPFLVKTQAMYQTGQLPKFKDDAFCMHMDGGDDYYLIPTSEVSLTNFHSDEILDEGLLPLRYVAYSPCFRAEAGAAGKDTRGLIRQHQFEKVEMVRFAKAEQSGDELLAMVDRASDLLSQLELPHRVIELCAGDLGFNAEKTFDIEVWLPGQDKYREISSCSSCSTFQARRGNIRYRSTSGEKSKPQLAVTLNGSGLPLGRTLVAILENHQKRDGSIRIPEILRPYFGGRCSLVSG